MKKSAKNLKIVIAILLIIVVSAGCLGGNHNVNDDNNGMLIITEVGSSFYANSSCWIEVYNNSSNTAQLSNYMLHSQSILRVSPYTMYSSTTFNLPSLLITPGSYAIIRGKSHDSFVNAGNIVYVTDSSTNTIPFWWGNGYVELVKNGATSDFVRFGNDETNPITASQWSGGDSPALPNSSPIDYGKSISRDGSNTDTNSAGDWVLRDFATAGGPNDVTSDVDTDQDGIPDCSEQPNSTFAGLHLYDWGARVDPSHKDIFIHTDYMDSSDPGVIPREEALNKIKQVFWDYGYNIHFDVGDLYSSTVNSAKFNLDGGNHRVNFATAITFGIKPGVENIYYYKANYMPLAKKQIFHYLLMAYSQNADGTGGSSGIAEINGNDLIVSLGNWGLNTSSSINTNVLINFQAATIMHEFGHNLGLNHGGDIDTNYKPNYYSIMNYLYQINGLPPFTVNATDRYYCFKKYTMNDSNFSSFLPNGLRDLVDGPGTANFRMDYSNGSGGSINENNAVEIDGIKRTDSTGIDLNGDGDYNDIVNQSINDDEDIEILSDYDDWSHLDLFFVRSFSGDGTGVSNKDGFRVWSDLVGDDRQEFIQETLYPNMIN